MQTNGKIENFKNKTNSVVGYLQLSTLISANLPSFRCRENSGSHGMRMFCLRRAKINREKKTYVESEGEEHDPFPKTREEYGSRCELGGAAELSVESCTAEKEGGGQEGEYSNRARYATVVCFSSNASIDGENP